jgi:hypothetical protein
MLDQYFTLLLDLIHIPDGYVFGARVVGLYAAAWLREMALKLP